MSLKSGIIANRPIRAFNPGSLDWHPEFHTWAEDLADPPHDINKDGIPGRVAVFKDELHGTKRLAIQVCRYLLPVNMKQPDISGHGFDTLRKYIGNYAPNNDPKAHNDEANYKASLAARLGLGDEICVGPHFAGPNGEVLDVYGQMVTMPIYETDGLPVIKAQDKKLNIREHLQPLVLGIAHMETGHELGDIWDMPDFIDNAIKQARARFGMAI